MSTFELAIPTILKHEGGLSEDPTDPGGITNFGISLRFLQSEDIRINSDRIINEQDVRDLTLEKATAIYKEYFWERYCYSSIHSQVIATKIFDMCVNMGPLNAHKRIQRACWAIGDQGTPNDDGILGDSSFHVINQCDARLLAPLKAEFANYYRLLVSQKPTIYQKYLNGYLTRAYS